MEPYNNLRSAIGNSNRSLLVDFYVALVEAFPEEKQIEILSKIGIKKNEDGNFEKFSLKDPY